MLVTQSCLTLCDPMDCSHQAPWSMEFSRQKYWSGLPFSSPRDIPKPGIKHSYPALQADSNHWATREALAMQKNNYIFIPCPEDPRRASKMIAHSERCQICDLWRRFNFRTRDQAWSLNNCKCYVLDNRDSKYIKEKLIKL